MNYGDFENKSLNNFSENIETKSKKIVSQPEALPKTLEVSRQIFLKTQNESSEANIELTDINVEKRTEKENISISEDRTNSLGKAIFNPSNKTHEDFGESILHSDLRREHSINQKKSNSSKYDSMSLDELQDNLEKLEQSLENSENTEEEVDQINNSMLEIMNKIEEFEVFEAEVYTELTKEQEKIDESITHIFYNEDEMLRTVEEDVVGLTTVKIDKDNFTENLHESKGRVLIDGVFRFVTADIMKDYSKHIYYKIDIESGALRISKAMAENFVLGQVIQVEDEKGNIVDVTLNSINILTEEELRSLITHFTDIHANAPKEEEKDLRHDRSRSLHSDNKSSDSVQIENTAVALQKGKKTLNPNLHVNLDNKSQRKEREKELQELQEKILLKKEIIKQEVLNHTILLNRIQHQDFSLTEEKRTVLDENIELDRQLNELIKQNNDPDHQSIEIPLQLIEKIVKTEKIFVEITKLIPKENVGISKVVLQAVKEVLPLKKEIVGLVKEAVTTGGGIKTTGKGNRSN